MLCVDGAIAAVGPDVAALVPAGAQVIDASGQFVMPGGIDPHTHMQLPFMGTVTADDFYTGTAAALAGGTTSIIDFVIPDPQEPLLDAYRKWRGWAEKAAADYSFHVAVTWWSDSVHADMGTLVREEGINSFKHFMAYKNAIMCDDETLVNSFKRALELGAMPTVHAENGELVYLLQQEVAKMGITGPEGHPLARPPMVEAEAANRAIAIAGVPGRAHLRGARQLHRGGAGHCRGPCTRPACVWRSAGRPSGDRRKRVPRSRLRQGGRPCDEPALPRQGPPGGLVAGPAVGPAAHHGHRPLHLLRRAEGHGPGQLRQDPQRHRRRGRAPGRDLGCGREHRPADAQRIRGHHLGQHRQAVQHLSAQGPGRRGGRRRIWSSGDPAATHTLSVKTQHSKGDYNIFEGRTVQGMPSHTISQGVVAYAQGDLRAEMGKGRYIKRPAFGPNFDAVQRRAATLQPTAVAR